MNSYNLTNPDKKPYQQPMLNVIVVLSSRSILQVDSGDTSTKDLIDNIE